MWRPVLGSGHRKKLVNEAKCVDWKDSERAACIACCLWGEKQLLLMLSSFFCSIEQVSCVRFSLSSYGSFEGKAKRAGPG